MEPLGVSVEVASLEDWPDHRLRAAYAFIARRMDRLLGTPDGDTSRREIGELRSYCEELGMELVRRDLM